MLREHAGTSPRKLPYRPWYLTVLLLTVILTIPQMADIMNAMQRTGKSLLAANPLLQVCSAGASTLFLCGMLLTVLLPGKRIGYRLCVYVLRIYNALWAVLLGVLGLAVAALIIITCLGIMNLPTAFAAAGIMLLAAAAMLLCTLFVHHSACCMNEAGGSAQDGKWQSLKGYEGPVFALAIGMAAICGGLLIAELLCVSDMTHGLAADAFASVFDSLYESVPTSARTLIRTIRTSLEPLLEVTSRAALLRVAEVLRYIAVALLYRDYCRMHRQ